MSCCNNLCDSYFFMNKVRKSEMNLRNGVMPPPKTEPIKEHEAIEEQSEALIEEDVEVVFETVTDDQAAEETQHIPEQEIEEIEESLDEIYEEAPCKKYKTARSKQLSGTITLTHYDLVQSDSKTIILDVSPREFSLDEDRLEFDLSWINNLPSDQDTVFRCKHCVKAFSNAGIKITYIGDSSSH